MQVLAVTPEIFPLIKTGGLADVTGALPIALGRQGIATRTLVPGFPQVLKAVGKSTPVHRYPAMHGGKASIVAVTAAGLDLLVLDAPHLFDRPGGPYGDSTGADWPDNWRRFSALSFAGADIAAGAIAGYRPDVVHAHDWQAALTLAYMRYGAAAGVPSVMTVHNLAFQGQFGAAIVGELGLPAPARSIDGVEYYGGVGYLKAGVECADAVTTVFDLIWSGVFERHPKLKVELVESEIGWIPFTLQQWDYYYNRFTKPGQSAQQKFEISRLPSEIFNEHVYATFMDDQVGSHMLKVWGEKNCMWSSDYPHANMTWPNSRAFLAKQIGDLDPARQKRLVHQNVIDLYKLKV